MTLNGGLIVQDTLGVEARIQSVGLKKRESSLSRRAQMPARVYEGDFLSFRISKESIVTKASSMHFSGYLQRSIARVVTIRLASPFLIAWTVRINV